MDHREFPVLYVDDEPENLRIFELTFRREFSVLTAESGEQGLQIMAEQPVAVVLSDHRMPGMTGVEFLSRVREFDPKMMRVLVTAYGDADILSRAVNDGSIYRYVPKPWDPDEMRLTVRRAIEVYALDREREELVRELSILSRVSRSINQELDLEPLLDLLLGTVIDDLGFDGASILFFDGSGHHLGSACSVPKDGHVAGWYSRFSLDADRAPAFLSRLREGEVQILTHQNAQDCERPVREWILEVAAEEMLVVPLSGKKGVIGAMIVDNRRGRRGFDVSDRTLLEGLATQAVIAIENARLVDDLRRSREQVIRADRLGTLGTLAAGLAHEINNPLVSIHTFLSLVQSKRSDDDPEFWNEYHGLALQEVERIRGLVASMERLGRGPAVDAPTEICDLGQVAEGVARLMSREAGKAEVDLQVDVQAPNPKVVSVRDHVHQVVLNLVLNAIEASPAGGRVTVTVMPDPRGDEQGIAIEVVDSGPGVAPEDLERIFDPFFTRKGPDKGTGLGLTICQQLVAGLGGSIEVRRRPGEGAAFRVRLPLELKDA